MSTKTNFGSLAIGSPFELYFSVIIDPATSAAYADLAGVEMKFSVKSSLSDLDAAAIATVRETDGGYSYSGGLLSLRLITSTISETLTADSTYYFSGWLEASNGNWYPFNFGTTSAPSFVGYFHTYNTTVITKD